MALESLILEGRERVPPSVNPENPVCGEKIPPPEEMAEEKSSRLKKVEKARIDEIDIAESMGVWGKIPTSQVPKGTKIIGTHGVDVNKHER